MVEQVPATDRIYFRVDQRRLADGAMAVVSRSQSTVRPTAAVLESYAEMQRYRLEPYQPRRIAGFDVLSSKSTNAWYPWVRARYSCHRIGRPSKKSAKEIEPTARDPIYPRNFEAAVGAIIVLDEGSVARPGLQIMSSVARCSSEGIFVSPRPFHPIYDASVSLRNEFGDENEFSQTESEPSQ